MISRRRTFLADDEGRLAAVIDFGCCAVGDPACDLVLAWTYLDHLERQVFRESVPVDDGAWARARGWALWKAVITIARAPLVSTAESIAARSVVDAVLLDHSGR